MIFELGLLLATYVGSRLTEKTVGEAEPTPPPTKDEKDAIQLRYLQGSLFSMGCFAVTGLLPGAGTLGIAAYLYSSIPYMRNVERSLARDEKVNVDVLFFTADVLTFGTRHYFTAALGLSMIHHGRYLVGKARDDSAKMVAHLYREMPQSVWQLIDGVEIETPLAAIKAGDLIIVTSGSVIPVDGVIQDGNALIDQQALTGESQPAEREYGDPVFANTIVIAGRLLIRVDRSGDETTSAQISEMLLNSVSFKSGVQLKGEQWADKMALPMLASAAVVLPLIGPVSTAVFINSHIGARILLFAPLTTLRHISEASKLGVLVKDGRALEQLGQVDTILFDKTGTLTTDEPEVTRVTARLRRTEHEILAYAATAERKLDHPIARAILEKAREAHARTFDVEDSTYTMGYGTTVIVDGKVIRVGSLRFFQLEGIRIPQDVLRMQQASHALGHTFILVGIDRHVAGTLELQPQIRSEASKMIAELRGLGIRHLAIVSGDDDAPTKKLAHDLGMDEYFCNVLPESKAQIVESLQAQGRVVCFIGDGINDSIALKKANVSMSIAGATSIAKDMAEIVYMDGSLTHLVEVIELARRLDVNLKRALGLCVVPSVVNLSGAFIFNFNILTALLVNGGFAALGVSDFFYVKKKALPKPAHTASVEDAEEIAEPVEPPAPPRAAFGGPARDAVIISQVARGSA